MRASFKTLLVEQGDTNQLLEECEAVVAYSSDNYQPLLWRYYRSYRSTLFRLVRHLAPASTTQDESLINALSFMLENEDRRSDTLAGAVDLSFASERWQRNVSRIVDGEVLIDRRHFEVCVLTHLAAELKSGDLSIAGSDEYADYREQLLDWEECEPLVAGYCREMELPATAQEFVAGLRTCSIKQLGELMTARLLTGNWSLMKMASQRSNGSRPGSHKLRPRHWRLPSSAACRSAT